MLDNLNNRFKTRTMKNKDKTPQKGSTNHAL